MILKELKPRKALNKAFLKVKPNRTEIEGFKTNLITLLDRTNDTESEEFHKNLVSDFLKKTYYDPNHFINTKGRNDLVIHNGQNANSTVGVILEAKKPTNKAEMITTQKLNAKAFQELVLYYLRERITHKNLEVKHLVATNINEWFIFDATLFDRLFAQNKNLVKQFNDFEGGRLADTKTDFFYKQIAEPFIDTITSEIEFTYFNIQDFQKPLRNTDKADDNSLIALFKLLSPEHLLKLPFTNDSNSLDKRFYSELLHIIGLTETKEGSKKLIQRNKDGERHTGTILEDAIIQLDSLDKLSRLEKPNQFGNTQQERLFNVALELSITWINRILFLKLLEAQLITYHKGDKSYSFLNLDKIKNYDDLNSLFFQVLARKYDERNEDVKKAFEKVPYLNSSLFEPTDIEQVTLFISNLKDDKTIPIFSQTVLKDQQGKKRTGNISTLQYLFEFLDAYDFGAEGGEEIQEDNKTLINASVLGLIFEKINGYKDGSFFTPGFITMYMCRETIRKAVVQKFNETKKWNCTTLEELYDKIEDRKEANQIVNSIKICDPAVGSGHFLVSALNEIIAVKNDLKILQDRDGKRLKEYQVEVVNDELIVTDEEGELFEYNPGSTGSPTNRESQRVQETLFHEKQTIIENCLFGVDINSNSVKICRLRLWIELLKNAYYKNATELETLPNIDINIKCGNSLVSRFAIDADLAHGLNRGLKSKWNIDTYKIAVSTYRNAESKEQKREMERLIADIKSDFRSEISRNDPKVKKLNKLEGELVKLTTQQSLFEMSKKEKADWNKKVQQISAEIKKLETEIEEIKANKIFENAFEWRFEFPEVLNDEGDFVGFDVVIGNPPYGVKPNEIGKEYFNSLYSATDDIYTLFIELGLKIISENSNISFINPITWLTGSKYKNTRNLFTGKNSLVKAINLPYDIFADAYVDTGIYFFQKKTIEQSSVYEFNPKDKIQIQDLLNIEFKALDRKVWTAKPDLKINLNESDNSIFSKLDSIQSKLSDFSETARGILADKSNYKSEFENGLKKVFTGNLNRYVIDETFSFIQYDDSLKEKPKSYSFFTGERILVRRIISRQFRMMATYTNEEFVCKKDIYIIKLNDENISYKYVLALLNSKLLSFYKTKNSGSAKKDDFTQITLGDIRQLPIPKIETSKQQKFIKLVDEILTAKEKNKDTTIAENELDQLVYQLYELTEEEIKIVEGNG
ncbi:putative type IIS restriction/modification enzyme [Leadbetterella byssophila DSM 17132]|uniref:site-specific DNA-methyltransferase (adenine-specific) n=1 Tax=Leadbetterella byssophila (strain DSM 17132 / JCM 16389 / KACC 11308 / NBRC 106382 / 4M15) TaxID=649349 RepID=E4RWN8_LEAB4|nr:TaqI-like C-terminal specificity domain-containing protein [Leadbetterella byssophila]ADQ16207.1 putative type IIS restriction/modification enzyme [Leadbetterella byssophila DSM 17132]